MPEIDIKTRYWYHKLLLSGMNLGYQCQYEKKSKIVISMKNLQQAGTELGQAQLKLELDFTFFLQIWFLPIWIGRIGLIK